MPAKSKKQMRFWVMVKAVKKGKLSPKKVSASVREAAEKTDDSLPDDYITPDYDKLPETVEEKEATHSQYHPAFWRGLLMNTTGADAGRATALLEASGEKPEYSIRKPYTIALGSAALGAGLGALAQHGIGGGWKPGATIGAMVGAAAALMTIQGKLIDVKRRLRRGDLEPEYSKKAFKQLPPIAAQNEDLALVKGLVSGAYDKAYVDQIMKLRDKRDSGAGSNAMNMAGDVVSKLVPGVGMLLSAPQGADAVGHSRKILGQSE